MRPKPTPSLVSCTDLPCPSPLAHALPGLSALDPHAHLFEVRCTIDDPAPGGQRFRLPTWVPGSYLIREFARHFVAGPRRECRRARWRSRRGEGHVARRAVRPVRSRSSRKVYAFDLSVRTAYLDTTRGYFNGGACSCPGGPRRRAVHARDRRRPTGPSYAAGAARRRSRARRSDFGRYRAADYDELIDHPVEMGDFALGEFRAGGVPHEIAITGRVDADLPRLAARPRAHLPVADRPLRRHAAASTATTCSRSWRWATATAASSIASSTSLLCRRESLPLPGRDGHDRRLPSASSASRATSTSTRGT